jgi:hypothetical protein
MSIIPSLFLLVAKGLSRYISSLSEYGALKGIKIGRNIILTHLIFVDDVLIFGNGSLGYESMHKEAM